MVCLDGDDADSISVASVAAYVAAEGSDDTIIVGGVANKQHSLVAAEMIPCP